MRILEQMTYLQPGGETRITLRRLETPHYPDYSAERLVNGKLQEWLYGLEEESAKRQMKEWVKFEKRISSKAL